jgi:hypothetical protein
LVGAVDGEVEGARIAGLALIGAWTISIESQGEVALVEMASPDRRGATDDRRAESEDVRSEGAKIAAASPIQVRDRA